MVVLVDEVAAMVYGSGLGVVASLASAHVSMKQRSEWCIAGVPYKSRRIHLGWFRLPRCVVGRHDTKRLQRLPPDTISPDDASVLLGEEMERKEKKRKETKPQRV